MNELTGKIQTEIKKVIVGKDDVVRRVLMAILAQGHVLLEDVPGVGKTTLAMAFAKTLGLKTARVQFTSDTMPSDIIGFSVYDKDTGKLSYKPGAVMTNLLLADEINRTSSKTQSALLEAMEEKRHRGRRDARASRAVHRARYAEPRRLRRYDDAAELSARPFPYPTLDGLS